MSTCPHCSANAVRILATRDVGGEPNRRRLCEVCGKRWWTVEIGRERLARLERAAAVASRSARFLSDTERASIEAALPIIERIMR